MNQEQPLDEHQSLQIITEMISKAKGSFHERGTSAILWGSVVCIAGLISFAERFWDFDIHFDIWLLVLAAIIPQIFISIKESRERKVLSHDESFMNAVWMVYGISVFALVFYMQIVPGVTANFITQDGQELLVKTIQTGKTEHFNLFIPSQSSIFLILYAIPTLATGIARKFKPMLVGGILCYVLFIISCYTSTTWDMLLMAIAGICNWLIPGIILRKRYLKGLSCNV
jgi:uncharacterized membrane protein